MSKLELVELLVDSQRVVESEYWEWDGSKFVITLGNLLALVKENDV